jgi:hypothetical protein
MRELTGLSRSLVPQTYPEIDDNSASKRNNTGAPDWLDAELLASGRMEILAGPHQVFGVALDVTGCAIIRHHAASHPDPTVYGGFSWAAHFASSPLLSAC